MMLLAVFERAALMLMTLFFLTRTRPFQRLSIQGQINLAAVLL